MTKQTSEKKTRGAGGRPVIDTERRTHVGQVIRKYRTEAGMDQAELAARLGYTKTAIGNWELGLTRPDIDNVPKLCKELSIPVTELLGMESEAALPTEDRRFLETLHQLDKFDRNTVWQIMDRLLFQQDSKEKARLRRAYMPLCRYEEEISMNIFEAIHGGENHRLWIGGHRGHTSAARENTTANFTEVLGMGVDYIEIDVQLTRDHQAVIFHDMALEERTPLHGHIRDYTVAELKAAFEIDTLEEALAWCKTHNMAVLLEVKSCELLMHEDMPYLAQRIVEALQKADFFDQCVVFGVNHWILREVCRLDSRCKIALIVPHVPDDPVALMQHMGAIIYLCFIDNLSRPLIDQLHAAGYLVDGSVINSKERMKTALEIGCDMVESDTPDQAIAWYRELTAEAKQHA